MTNGKVQKTNKGVSGTVHVTVLEASKLPIMDFAKQQDPYVLVSLDITTCGEKAKTNTIIGGGQYPKWGENDNRHLELHLDGNIQYHQLYLTTEVWNDDIYHPQRVGIGKTNITSIINSTEQGPEEVTVRILDQLEGKAFRGEIKMLVSFGLPVRKSIRALQKATEILRFRDAFVRSLYTTRDCIWAYLWPFLEKPVNAATHQITEHKTICFGLVVFMSAIIIGITGISIAAAIPVFFMLIFTLPFWIIPVSFGGFIMAPIWLPVVFFSALFITGFILLGIGIGLTSRPVRRRVALLVTKMKQSKVGQKLIYH